MMELDRQNAAAAHWSREQYESLFAQDESQAIERLILVAEEISASPSETRTEEASPVRAFLVALRVDSEWELENMVVSKTFQRQGIGIRLLNEFLEQARAEGGGRFFSKFASQTRVRALSTARPDSRKPEVERAIIPILRRTPSCTASFFREGLPIDSHKEIAPEIWH